MVIKKTFNLAVSKKDIMTKNEATIKLFNEFKDTVPGFNLTKYHFSLIFEHGYKLGVESKEGLKLKPLPKGWDFCETPKEECTMNYCDDNGCQNRKRNLVEPKELDNNNPNK